MKTEHVDVTPEVALIWLSRSGGNRAMRADHIAQLAAQMRRGEWLMNGSTIVFDTKGMLLDGHHRLMACHVAGETIGFLVVWQADPAAMFTIDTGRARKLEDHLTMHGATQQPKKHASYISACVRILAGSTVSIRTAEAFLAWHAIFKDGFDAYFALGCHAARHMRNASVAGPIIVAFKAFPTEFEKVMIALRDGTDLKAGAPLHTLREFLVGSETSRLARDTAEGMANKIFAALLAHIEQRTLRKLMPSAEALEHFRALYARGNARKMIDEARSLRSDSRRMVENVIPGAMKK